MKTIEEIIDELYNSNAEPIDFKSAKNKLKSLLEEERKEAFEGGKNWGETYGGWFMPTKEDFKKVYQDYLNQKQNE